MQVFLSLLFIASLSAFANAQFDISNVSSTVLSYYKTIYNGTGLIEVWDEDWRLIPLSFFSPNAFINLGIHFGTTILTAHGQGLIGGVGSGGSSQHTCYVGNLLPPTCLSQHWQYEAGFKVGPGAGEGSGISGWTDFTSEFGNAYVGFVVESFYEIDAAGEYVEDSKIEFDDYSFFTGDGELKDIASALWYWSSPGKQVDVHPGGKNVTYMVMEFKPVLTALGDKALKFTFLFTNTFAKLDTAGAGRVDTSLTAKGLEAIIEVTRWEYKAGSGGAVNQHKLAFEIDFFTTAAERITYGDNGISVVQTTDPQVGTARRKRQTLTTDGFETILPSEGAISVWQAAGDWVDNPGDITYFTLMHDGLVSGQTKKLRLRQRRYDASTGKTKDEMKNALYDDYVGGIPLDEAVKTVWNVGQIYFNKFFDNKPLQQTATVYEYEISTVEAGASSLKYNVGMGVGPYINPNVDTNQPDYVQPTCTDGIRNQGETDVDCGGGASKCPPCESCDNGIKDQSEQLVDCGGPNCPLCDPSLLVGMESKDGIPYWVWIIVGVVGLLLCAAVLCLVFFLVLASGNKKGKKGGKGHHEGSLRYGTATSMGEVRKPSHRTGRSRASSRAESRATLGTERSGVSRSASQANLPSW